MNRREVQIPPATTAQPDSRIAKFAPWRRRPVLRGEQGAFAVLLSLFVHLALILLFAVTFLERPTAGLSGSGGVIASAIMTQTELTELMDSAAAEGAPAIESAMEEVVQIDDVMSPVSEAALSSLEVTELGNTSGAGEALGEGMEMGAGAGGGSAKFFGVEARGSRFAYVVDCSGSMTGERLDALKIALAESVEGLLEHTHFSIVLFNSEAFPLTGSKWISATERFKTEVKREIGAITANGGTNPLPALAAVFAMKPRPDAIYLMTDGQFAGGTEEQIIAQIARMNNAGDRRTPIHCISFIERSSEEIMRRIARQSGGTYTHIPAVGARGEMP